MPLRYTNRILQHIAHEGYEPSTADAIARDMNVEPEDREAFHEAVAMLKQRGQIDLGRDDLIRLPSYGEEMVGRFRLNPRGFGFVIPDSAFREGDLFIPFGQTKDAVSGDRVRARVVRDSRRGRSWGKNQDDKPKREVSGRIVEVLERGQSQFAGTLVQRGRTWVVEPDGRALFGPVVIRDPHAKNAKAGDKVVIELLQYPEGDLVAEGVILKVLGEAGRPDVETQAVIIAHDLRVEFPQSAMDQARAAGRDFEKDSQGPWPDREDLTQTFIFTIDPPDAKDFDDAISIKYDAKRDQWELGVHIADVVNFVQVGSALDHEARERGNSVYLPRLVLPMLPETLSNGVCSLQEGVPRFTKSAFMTLDGKGRVLGQRLANTVIKSAKRLTYLEAQALLAARPPEARHHARTETLYTDHLVEALKLSNRLAKILHQRRREDGMIELNLPEVELIFDENGHVTDAVPEDDAYTHRLIEMFMVEANEAVARTFASLNVPVLRRIHPEPVKGDIEEMRMYARAARVDVPENPTRKDLQRLLDLTRQTPAARAVHFAVLRTLAKASYSPALIGHFALASEHYAHFTSPIRRYPDLSLHRVIDAYLELTDNGLNTGGDKRRRELGRRLMDDSRVLDEGELMLLGQHCSQTEIEAEQAERELRNFLVMQFLQEHHLGDEFPGVITGVTNGGVFVSIERFLVEGLVKMQDLPSGSTKAERWSVNPKSGRLTAQRSGLSMGVGDIVTVQVASVNLPTRRMDLLITKLPQRDSTQQAPGEPYSRKRNRGNRDKPGKGKFKPKQRPGKKSKRRR